MNAHAQCELATLRASDGAPADQFSQSTAISGDVLVIGAPEEDNAAGSSAGAAYVYRRAAGVWSQEQKLTPLDANGGDDFGFSVAVLADIIVVGAPRDDDLGGSSGSAYVFRFDGSTWTQQAKLLAADGGTNDRFGQAVSINNGAIVVGAPQEDSVQNNAGAAYVFRNSGSNWPPEQKLTAPDLDDFAQFGRSVAIDGDTAIVGAWQAEPAGTFLVGAAYVFRRSGVTWTLEQKLTASNAADFRWFGVSVAISGDDALVGAFGDRANDLSESGGAYFFERVGGVWNETQNVHASDAEANDRFGWSVALQGENAVIGASAAAEAYWFTRNGGVWAQQAGLESADPGLDASFGQAVAIDGSDVVVGDPFGGGNGFAVTFELGSIDSDHDGTPDCTDGCPDDANKTAPGACGCGTPEAVGDLDGNGAVNLADLAVLLSNFGTPSGAAPSEGDIDNDGDIDLADLSVMLANFGSTCP